MKSIHIIEKTLPAGWERAVVATWFEGARFRTEYDKASDPESRDVTCLIHVTEPFAEPRIHRAFPGGLEDLEKYRAEVLLGVHDHWIDPKAGKWEYTYHERLFQYDVPGVGVLDQIQQVIDKLREAGHTRRAQAVTWKAWEDVGISDPACLQRLWFRLEDGRLNLSVHMRSNDAYKAAFMNMYAFTELQKFVADALGAETGQYIHISDSFHIYGSYFSEFEGFLSTVQKRARADRYFSTDFARDFFADGVRALLDEKDLPPDKRPALEKRLNDLGASSSNSPSVIMGS